MYSGVRMFLPYPLHKAAAKGEVGKIKKYLDRGGNPNLRNSFRCTLLHSATSNGQTEIANLLLDANADPNLVSYNLINTPLHLAALKGHLSIVQMLVEYGADLSLKNMDGLTPLGVAEKEGHSEVIDLLLVSQNSMNMNIKGEEVLAERGSGKTPS